MIKFKLVINMQIMEYIESLTDVCGIADLNKDNKKLIKTYGKDICKYPYAIVIGHKMNEDIIETIPLTYNDDKLAKKYNDEYYNSHKRASNIAKKINNYIQNEGYDGIILDVSGKSDEINLKQSFSNKASAHIAGVGWLGKNNLLTTKEFGPRLTWVTILTNAPLGEYTGVEMESLCDECTLCVNACPGNAIVDLPDPSKSYSPEKCGKYIMSRRDEGHPMACGMCLYICPYGNNKSRKILEK
ncbi:hypothetical protein NL43_04320 [Methanosphaera sp. WGK6]|nr:hypothetical protein NL43_04320 [Methanosphaera sp. WGK6]